MASSRRKAGARFPHWPQQSTNRAGFKGPQAEPNESVPGLGRVEKVSACPPTWPGRPIGKILLRGHPERPARDPGPPHADLRRRDRRGCPPLSLDRFEQRGRTDDVQDACQIVGEDAQRHLGGDLGKRLHSCAHAHLPGAERVLGGLAPRAHGVRIFVAAGPIGHGQQGAAVVRCAIVESIRNGRICGR
jgi:hypothetical protein